MSTYLRRHAALFVLCTLRPIRQPLENAGTKKPALDAGHIDDGFWQGPPVEGYFGSPDAGQRHHPSVSGALRPISCGVWWKGARAANLPRVP